MCLTAVKVLGVLVNGSRAGGGGEVVGANNKKANKQYLNLKNKQTTAGYNAPGAFLVFLMDTCVRPPVFAQPNKYSLQTSSMYKNYLWLFSVDSPKFS